MEVNGQNFENIKFVKALEILRNNIHLAFTVKANIFGEFCFKNLFDPFFFFLDTLTNYRQTQDCCHSECSGL